MGQGNRRTMEDIPEKEDLVSRVNEEEAMDTNLQEEYQRIAKRKISEIKVDVLSRIPQVGGAEILVSDATGGGRSDTGMSGMVNFMNLLGIGNNQERIIIKGSDFEMMQLVAEDIRYQMDQQEFIQNTTVSFMSRQPEILLDFDQILLTSFGITRANILTGLSELNGEFSSGTTFKVGDESYDIIIRDKTIKEEEEQQQRVKTIDDLNAVQIINNNGGLHNLKDIATVNKGYGRSRIIRVNQDKQLEVRYSFLRSIEESKTCWKASCRYHN